MSTLPIGLRGISATTMSSFGHLYPANDSRHHCDNPAVTASTSWSPRGELDQTDQTFPHLGILDADARHVGDRGMALQRLFRLGRVDVDTTGHDHVGEAVGDVDEPVVVDVADLAQA